MACLLQLSRLSEILTHNLDSLSGGRSQLMLCALASIHAWGKTRVGVVGIAAAAFLLAGLLNGIARFHDVAVADPAWPRWADELARWRADPRHNLRIWPQGWGVDLSGDPQLPGDTRMLPTAEPGGASPAGG